MKSDNLIVITSVINTSKNPLNYTSVRSVYSQEERYDQTLKTIESCAKIPNKKILFIETSQIDKNMEDNIKKLVDHYYNFFENPLIREITDGPHAKTLGESTQLWEALSKTDLEKYENIFKISGRYYLSEDFDFTNYDNDDNIFKEGPNRQLGTVMYKVNKKSFSVLMKALDFCRENKTMLERNYGRFFFDNHKTLPKIGVEGCVSVDGNFIRW